MDESKNDLDKDSDTLYSKNERLLLTITDFLMFVMIIVDLLYLGEYLSFSLDYILIANIVMIIISFVAYQQKKRIRKRNVRLAQKKKEDTS